MGEQLAGKDVDLNFILKKTTIRDVDFFQFAETQITEKNYSFETRRMYRIFVEKIKGFRAKLKLSEVDFKFLQGYQNHLRNELKNCYLSLRRSFVVFSFSNTSRFINSIFLLQIGVPINILDSLLI